MRWKNIYIKVCNKILFNSWVKATQTIKFSVKIFINVMIKMDIKNRAKSTWGGILRRSYKWMHDLLMNINNKVCPWVLWQKAHQSHRNGAIPPKGVMLIAGTKPSASNRDKKQRTHTRTHSISENWEVSRHGKSKKSYMYAALRVSSQSFVGWRIQ